MKEPMDLLTILRSPVPSRYFVDSALNGLGGLSLAEGAQALRSTMSESKFNNVIS